MKIYDKQQDCLVFYEKKVTSNFWDEHWDKYYSGNLKKTIENYKTNRYIIGLTKRYLDTKEGRVLEGGCGIGGYVYCLQRKGYNVYGVDSAEKTIKRVKETFSNLNVSVDDVRNLSFSDCYFGIYYSFGVIEHFIDGYDEIIKEAYRVLKPNGYFIITFPQISVLRRIKILLDAYSNKNQRISDEFEFYQFAFNPLSVIRNLQRHGFKLISRKGEDGLRGFKQAFPVFRPILQRLYDYRGENYIIRAIRLIINKTLAPFCGHMCQLVMQKF